MLSTQLLRSIFNDFHLALSKKSWLRWRWSNAESMPGQYGTEQAHRAEPAGDPRDPSAHVIHTGLLMFVGFVSLHSFLSISP